MGNGVFEKSGTFLLPGSQDKNAGRPVTVEIGGQKATNCRLINEAGGKQPFRMQYEIALDGSKYLLAAGKGAGSYAFTLLEGPFEPCDGQNATVGSFLQNIKSMDTAASRKIKITTQTATPNSAMFTGYIIELNTDVVVDQDGNISILIIVHSIGQWE